MDNVKAFGLRIKALRVERQLSQEELAKIAGLHRTYIGSIERGEKNCTIKNVFRLAEALETNPAEIFRGL